MPDIARAMPRVFLASTPALSLALATSLVACSIDSGSDTPNGGATGGVPSGMAGGGAAASGAPTTGGAGSGQTSAGSGGSSGVAGGGAGGVTSAGGSAGSGGMGGAAGGGSGGVSFWGPGGPKKQFTCPGEPYPAQTMGQSTNICVGFKYNYGYNEGPTWIASENAFFFSNFIQGSNMGGDIIKYTLGGACEVWLHDVGCNGLGVSPSGNLLGACHGPRAVMEYDVKTKQGRMVATMAGGKMLDSPNDLIARSDGNVYFSNTTYELGPRPQGLGTALVRIDPMGMTSVIQMGGLNGVALSPDETKLYVVGMGVWTLDAAGVPGQKGGNAPGGDGIAVDCAGAVSNNGTNSAFGGPDGKTLIVVGGGTNAKTVAMTVPGLP
jgi:gluconolactonase